MCVVCLCQEKNENASICLIRAFKYKYIWSGKWPQQNKETQNTIKDKNDQSGESAASSDCIFF